MAVGVVVNPVAGSGRMQREWPRIEKALRSRLGPLDVKKTGGPGEACHLAWQFAMGGAELVVAVGGDGTVSETADGLLQAHEVDGRSADLAFVPVGTGLDFARGLDVPVDVEELAARIAEGERRRIDAGRVCYVNDEGALASRHFINIASLGISGPIDRAVNSAKGGGRRFSGKLLFLVNTVRELIRYKFQHVRVVVDDGEPVEAHMALVAIANAPYFGGGMKIAPDAKLADALFEVVIVHARSKLSLLADLRLVYTGRHTALPSCTFLRGKKIVVEPQEGFAANAALLDIDGESPGRIPATFEVIPNAITVRG
jgi:YegS/Rv2252/BmrU family lipid kinase